MQAKIVYNQPLFEAQATYADRVADTSPIAHFPMNETSGTTIEELISNYDGVYSGVALNQDTSPMGDPAPQWDGAASYGYIYSSGLSSAWDCDEATITIWMKGVDANFWDDTTIKALFNLSNNAATSRIYVRKAGGFTNTIEFVRTAGGTTKTISVGSQTDTGWICYQVAVSISGSGLLSAGEMKAYKAGVEIGSVTGNLASTDNVLGTQRTAIGSMVGISASSPMDGYLVQLIVHDRPIDNDILALSAA